MTDRTVLRGWRDVTPEWLTDALRADGRIDEARVAGFATETIGAGLMGICARYTLEYDRTEAGAPASVVGKFAAEDDTARNFMASSGYPNELCFYRHFAEQVAIRVPRCSYAAIDEDGWFTLVLEDLAPAEPGDQLAGCRVDEVEAAVAELVGLHAPLWDDPALPAHECFVANGTVDTDLLVAGLGAVVPGFLERYGAAFDADHVRFYERLPDGARNWFRARPVARTLAHSDYRPDNLLFGTSATGPTVAAVDWQGFSFGSGLSDVSFVIGNALTVDDRRVNEERIVRAYHDRLVGAGVTGYSWVQCWDDYQRSLLSALMTTIFGAMYGLRTDRGDRMFESMGYRHAAQILDLGADRFLEG